MFESIYELQLVFGTRIEKTETHATLEAHSRSEIARPGEKSSNGRRHFASRSSRFSKRGLRARQHQSHCSSRGSEHWVALSILSKQRVIDTGAARRTCEEDSSGIDAGPRAFDSTPRSRGQSAGGSDVGCTRDRPRVAYTATQSRKCSWSISERPAPQNGRSTGESDDEHLPKRALCARCRIVAFHHFLCGGSGDSRGM